MYLFHKEAPQRHFEAPVSRSGGERKVVRQQEAGGESGRMQPEELRIVSEQGYRPNQKKGEEGSRDILMKRTREKLADELKRSGLPTEGFSLDRHKALRNLETRSAPSELTWRDRAAGLWSRLFGGDQEKPVLQEKPVFDEEEKEQKNAA